MRNKRDELIACAEVMMHNNRLPASALLRFIEVAIGPAIASYVEYTDVCAINLESVCKKGVLEVKTLSEILLTLRESKNTTA